MPKYFYTAKSQAGQTISGDADAKDEQELAHLLKEDGLFLVSFKASGAEEKKLSLPSFGVSSLEKIFFVRNLRVMVGAGISLPRAISVLSSQAKNKKFKKALSDIEEKIVKGKTFSESLADFPEIFPELFQNMVKIGEETGTLEQVLTNLGQQLEKTAELKSKIKGALIYPAVVVLAMTAIGLAMLIIVVPQLAETFAELELDLPLTTKAVIWLGNFLKQNWYLFPPGIVFLFLVFRRVLRTKPGKKFFDSILLKLPIVANLIRETASANFARTLSALTASGVPLIRGLEIIAGTMGNVYFEESLINASQEIKKGAKLSEALKPYENLYLPIVVQMIQVGEETGETSQVLQQLSGFLEEEVANATKNLAALIEPLLMLAVGAAVGFFAISMIQPMYSMLEGIQ